MVITAAVLAGFFQSKDIESYCQSGLRDMTFVGTLKKGSPTEAGKIDNDWRTKISFRSIKVFSKDPFKLRVESTTDDTSIVYICNGNTQYWRAPKLNINKKRDVTNEPGQRQTAFDFGILTPGLVKGFFVSKFVRFDRETGNPVFDLTWPAKWDNTSRHRVWIDKDDKYIVRREWYGQQGQLKGIILNTKPVKEGGVAFPTVQQTFNAENKLAGEFWFSGVKINDGVSDALFSL